MVSSTYICKLLFLVLEWMLIGWRVFGKERERKRRRKKALREDRTPDLSLTKRVLYRLSY